MAGLPKPRPRSIDETKSALVRQLILNGVPHQEVVRQSGVSGGTVSKIRQQLKANVMLFRNTEGQICVPTACPNQNNRRAVPPRTRPLSTTHSLTATFQSSAAAVVSADASAISYWISTPEGAEVVTTIDTVSGRDTDAEHHAITRFSARLLPGQTQLISVPVAIGQEQPVLSIRRVGNQIEMTRCAGSSI